MRDDTPDDLVHDVFAGALFPGHPLGREVAGHAGDDHRGDARRRSPRTTPTHYQPVERRGRGRGQRRPRRRGRSMVDGRAARADGRRAARARRAAPTPATPSRFARRRPPARAGARRARRPRAAARRPRPLRAGGRRPGARRRDELAALPGGAREARPGVLGVLVPQRVRGDRRARGLLRHRARAGRRDARRRATASSTAWSPTAASPTGSSSGAKGHLTGSLALSLESSSSRMHRIGRSELTMGEIPSLDEVVEQVEAVTADDVARVIDRVLGAGLAHAGGGRPGRRARRRRTAEPEPASPIR